jgi:hypothetical protein
MGTSIPSASVTRVHTRAEATIRAVEVDVHVDDAARNAAQKLHSSPHRVALRCRDDTATAT